MLRALILVGVPLMVQVALSILKPAFAALKTDGSIAAWGDSDSGGTSPSGSGYAKIYSTWQAFAAIKTDGSITVQLAIAPPELLKVMLVMAEPIVATWSVAFARLGASTFTVKEKLALPVLCSPCTASWFEY
jgi:hypothetical protein